MKRILFVALIGLAIASCDTPQPTTGSGTDTAATKSNPTDTTTKKPDSTRQQ